MGVIHMKDGVVTWSGEWDRKPKTDCRFYDEIKKDCTALRCLYCAYGHKECNFYKVRESYDD